MIRFGIVGAGRHGERYLRHLLRGDVEGATVTAVSRRDATALRRLGSDYGVRTYSSCESLLAADDIDAVIIATPPMGHADEIRLALAAPRPVLVEKPVTGRWEQAKALLEAVGEGAPVMVAQTLRFHPVLEAVREQMGRLGQIHRIRLAQRLQPTDLAWQGRAEDAGGGSVTLTGVHLFDLLRWLVGRTPDFVQASLASVQGAALENLFDACFGYDDPPLLAATEVSKFTASRSAQLEIVGSLGQFDVDYLGGIALWRRGAEVETLIEAREVSTIPRTVAAFVAWQRGEIPCPVPLVEAVQTLKMAEACYRSHEQGRRIRLDDLDS